MSERIVVEESLVVRVEEMVCGAHPGVLPSRNVRVTVTDSRGEHSATTRAMSDAEFECVKGSPDFWAAIRRCVLREALSGAVERISEEMSFPFLPGEMDEEER